MLYVHLDAIEMKPDITMETLNHTALVKFVWSPADTMEVVITCFILAAKIFYHILSVLLDFVPWLPGVPVFVVVFPANQILFLVGLLVDPSIEELLNDKKSIIVVLLAGEWWLETFLTVWILSFSSLFRPICIDFGG